MFLESHCTYLLGVPCSPVYLSEEEGDELPPDYLTVNGHLRNSGKKINKNLHCILMFPYLLKQCHQFQNIDHKQNLRIISIFKFQLCVLINLQCVQCAMCTYRVVTTSRLKAPRHLVVLVHNNLKTFTKYSERSVHNLQLLPK